MGRWESILSRQGGSEAGVRSLQKKKRCLFFVLPFVPRSFWKRTPPKKEQNAARGPTALLLPPPPLFTTSPLAPLWFQPPVPQQTQMSRNSFAMDVRHVGNGPQNPECPCTKGSFPSLQELQSCTYLLDSKSRLINRLTSECFTH